MVSVPHLLILLVVAAAGVYGAAVPAEAADGSPEAFACYLNPYNGYCEYCSSSNGFDAVLDAGTHKTVKTCDTGCPCGMTYCGYLDCICNSNSPTHFC